jgi:hypothetical protein
VIYLASPYSHPGAPVRAERARACGRAVLLLAQQNIQAFAPVFYGHELETKFKTHLSYDYWIDFGLRMMEKCAGVYVLTLSGWRESRGVRKECERAHALHLPITGFCLNPDEDEDEGEVSGTDIRRQFNLPLPKAHFMRTFP